MDFNIFDMFQTSVLKLINFGQWESPVPFDLILVVAGPQRYSRLILDINCP